jgi:integrase
MSLWKPGKSPYWHYDFVLKGRRHHGSTATANRRAAQAFEDRLRRDAAEGRLGHAAGLTIDQACGLWWDEVGKDRGDAADVERRLRRLPALLGKTTPLAQIDMAAVSRAIQRRRGQTYRRGPGAEARLPANATVNRDVIETLRPILRRAALHWGAQGLPAIDWRELRLKEPAPAVRIYTAAQQAAWRDAAGPVAELAVRLLLTYGPRLGELFFALDAFEAEGARLFIHKRKRDVPLALPLLEEDARDIAARVGRARAAGLDHIWFEEDRHGRLIPITYHGLKGRLTAAADRAGIPGGRRIHGARHHAGSNAVRAGGLWLGQQLLGHADPKSTQRYAHLREADLRAMLEALPSRNSPEPPPTHPAKPEGKQDDAA